MGYLMIFYFSKLLRIDTFSLYICIHEKENDRINYIMNANWKLQNTFVALTTPMKLNKTLKVRNGTGQEDSDVNNFY